jgi:hypothetical protein
MENFIDGWLGQNYRHQIGHPPMIKKGMIVIVVKVILQIPYFDLILENGKYHRWLAEFEITNRFLVQSQ